MMTIQYKDRGASAGVGGKRKPEKQLRKTTGKKTAEKQSTLQGVFPLPEMEYLSQASEAVIGLPACLRGLDLHEVKSSSNGFLLPQQPAQPTPLASVNTEKNQATSLRIRIDLMSDKIDCPDQQQEAPTSTESKSRLDALTLLRARTASRSSPTETSSSMDSSLQSGAQSHASDNLQPNDRVTTEETASLKKGKKKKKSKKKYKKLDLASVAPNLSSAPRRRVPVSSSGQSNVQIPVFQPPDAGGPSKTSSTSAYSKSSHNVDPSPCSKDTKPVDYAAAVKGTNWQDKTVSSVEKNPQVKNLPANLLATEITDEKDGETCDVPISQSKSAKSNKKGKRRVAEVNPVTGEEVPTDPQSNDSVPESDDTTSNIVQGVDNIPFESGTNESSAATTAISTPPPRPSQSLRRGSEIHTREKLSPIQEAGDSDVDNKKQTSETRSLLTSTPKSSATVWSTLAPQATPYSEESANESKETGNQRQEDPGRSSSSAASHAHPGSPAGSEMSTPAATSTQGSVSTQKPEGFFWQLDSHGFPCIKPGCDKRCNLWDGVTVICPSCGPYSEVRYCCKEHLFDDAKWHWMYCGQMTFEHPCRESSIPRQVREGPVMVPCLHAYDTPERHRQAVRFSSDARTGDYFIFSDWADFVDAGFPEDNLENRCTYRVVYVIKFDDPEEKDRFRRVLATCLYMTLDVHELVDYLFRLIRDKLRLEGAAQELEVALKYQFHSEFNVTIQERITGERHACETDWNGKNRRNCADAVCRGEYRRLLGSPSGRGHSQLLDHLEGTYWMLRTARTTHPTVSSIVDRMRGEGFDQVADEDRRVFRRGEGWDGAGTGEMETEGKNA